jgi:phospholipase/lecithinase/hemolysin
MREFRVISCGQYEHSFAAGLTGEGVATFDIFGLGTLFAQDPLVFGFTNVTNACETVANANYNTYEYWDGIHPTAAAHMVIADAFLAVAVPEPVILRQAGPCLEESVATKTATFRRAVPLFGS